MTKIADEIRERFPSAVEAVNEERGELTVVVNRLQNREILKYLRDYFESPFNFLMDLCGVDYLGQSPRFEIVYHLFSLSKKSRIRIKCKVTEGDATIASVVDIYPTADWYEREVFDMFGIRFENHPNLKRLLMWDEFEGFPLRKDYPINKRQPIPKPKGLL
jgi:NADH-quinone oxidoreductase subunit C